MPIPAGPTGVSVEIKVQRELTHAFIIADPRIVVLERSARVPDGAGGYRTPPPIPVTGQVMRLIPLGDGAPERHTLDGRIVEPTYKLLGEFDADMLRGDKFTLSGVRYEVVFVSENTAYETKGEVITSVV